jgi:hypothetical protein
LSIVVRGFGLDVDSSSSIVAFGLTRNHVDTEEPVQVVNQATIDESYVVEFSGAERKPTPAEWARWRRWVQGITRGGLQITVKKRRGRTEYLVENTRDTKQFKQQKRLERTMNRRVKRA